MSIARLVARRRRLPPEALFSHRTAAWLHGLDVPPCDPIEVTLPRLSRTSHLAGIALTRSDVTETEASTVQDLPVTSGTRTIADLGRRLALVEAVGILDMALHRRVTDIERLKRWADTHSGYRGVARLKRAIELAEPATESPMETRLRLLLLSNGLPAPCVQVPLHDVNGFFVARPDLYYARQRLVLEYDGATHRNSRAEDNRRQNRLIDAGYRVLRFTAGDILNTPAAVAGLVRRALAT
jgi:hypothetical protein